MKEYFYNIFHLNTSLSKKIITWLNFTYVLIYPILKNQINNKKKFELLDIGCGAGTISLLLASWGNKVEGIDISSVAIDSCKKSATLLNLEKYTNFKQLDFKDYKENKKFDCILFLEVIEHLENDKKALRKIFDLIRPSGKLIISAPSKNAPLYRLGYARNFDKRVGHLRRYTLEELQGKLEDAGFKILERYKKEGILRNFLFLNPVAGKLIRFIRGPLTCLVTFLDNISAKLFGESDLILVAEK